MSSSKPSSASLLSSLPPAYTAPISLCHHLRKLSSDPHSPSKRGNIIHKIRRSLSTHTLLSFSVAQGSFWRPNILLYLGVGCGWVGDGVACEE
ncbi:hypothetical protein DMENIID0001_037240 [Sergentomyia squamirostris]